MSQLSTNLGTPEAADGRHERLSLDPRSEKLHKMLQVAAVAREPQPPPTIKY